MMHAETSDHITVRMAQTKIKDSSTKSLTNTIPYRRVQNQNITEF